MRGLVHHQEPDRRGFAHGTRYGHSVLRKEALPLPAGQGSPAGSDRCASGGDLSDDLVLDRSDNCFDVGLNAEVTTDGRQPAMHAAWGEAQPSDDLDLLLPRGEQHQDRAVLR